MVTGFFRDSSLFGVIGFFRDSRLVGAIVFWVQLSFGVQSSGGL